MVHIKVRPKEWFLSLFWSKPNQIAKRHALNLLLVVLLYFLPFLILVLPIPDFWVKTVLFLISYFSLWVYILLLGKNINLDWYVILGVIFAAFSAVTFQNVWWLLVFPLTVVYGFVRLIIAKPPFLLEVYEFDDEIVGGWERVAQNFREWWQDLWGEYLRCPVCAQKAGAGMYDVQATFSVKDAKKPGLELGSVCPICSVGRLEYFWNSQSARGYVEEMQGKPDYRGIVGLIEGKLAGWFFGYRKEGNYYLDTLAIFEGFRLRPFRYYLFFVFWGELLRVKRLGFKRCHFRTLRKATYIKRLAKLFGFYPTGIVDPQDETREWWLLHLTNWNLVKSAVIILLLNYSPTLEKILNRIL